MKKSTARALSIAYVVGMGFGFTSCKDDEPPVPPKLSFTESAMTVGEDDGVIEVSLKLDRAYGKDLTVEYNLSGTASDQHAVGDADADYKVVGNRGVVTIPSGQTSGAIEIEILNDGRFEEDETIEISIIDVNTSDVQLGTPDKVTVTIANDDTPLVASFAGATMSVNEAVGELLLVPVQLDKPAPVDIIVEYSILRDDTWPEDRRPDAMDSVSAWNANPSLRRPFDYYINAVPTEVGKLKIPAGETSANIEIQVISDFFFDEEGIRIQLKESSATSIGTNGLMTINVEQEDGKVILLLWDNDAYTDVDMDMMLWIGEDVDNLEGWLAMSARATTQLKEEVIVVPTVFSDDVIEAGFGLSYVYYSGSASPLEFDVLFIDFAEGNFEAEAGIDAFTESYTTANLNPWDNQQNGTEPIVVQTFRITNGEYLELTGITVPTTGSRIKKHPVPSGFYRTKDPAMKPVFR